MNLEQFEDMITLLKETCQVSGKAGKYIKSSVFAPFDKLIMMLLTNTYQKDAVMYILFEWLSGNKSELKVSIDENTSAVYPLETVEDLYTVMEMYKVN